MPFLTSLLPAKIVAVFATGVHPALSRSIKYLNMSMWQVAVTLKIHSETPRSFAVYGYEALGISPFHNQVCAKELFCLGCSKLSAR